jgi:hypothetical protein
MNLENIFITEFDSSKAITYPESETKGSLDRQPCDLMSDDYNFNHGIGKHANFRIHHVETLQPVIYYLRGLIDHETNKGTLIKRYVFSARINLNNFGHDDFLELLDKVIDKIKAM